MRLMNYGLSRGFHFFIHLLYHGWNRGFAWQPRCIAETMKMLNALEITFFSQRKNNLLFLPCNMAAMQNLRVSYEPTAPENKPTLTLNHINGKQLGRDFTGGNKLLPETKIFESQLHVSLRVSNPQSYSGHDNSKSKSVR